MKVLFLSHDGSLSGAPLSLRILLTYFSSNTDWDIKILMRKGGGLKKEYDKIAKTGVYYKYISPQSNSRNINNLFSLISEVICVLRNKSSYLFPAYNSLKKRKLLNKIPKRILNSLLLFLNYRNVKHIERKLKRWEPDLIYSNTALNGDIISYINLKSPIIVHVRELGETFNLLTDLQIDCFKKYPQHYFAVSKAVKKYLIKEFKISDEKISVVPVAVEYDHIKDSQYYFDEDFILKDLGVLKGDFIICGIGAVHPRKGCEKFVEIAKIVKRKYDGSKNLKFIWFGDGNMRKGLIKKLEDENLDSYIKFVGAKDKIYSYLKVISLLLMTSRDDPFPRVNLEVAAFEKPVIAFTDSGGSCEFIEEDCGFHVKNFDEGQMAEKTLEMINNDSLRNSFGKNARIKVQDKYDVSIIGAMAINYIKEIWGK